MATTMETDSVKISKRLVAEARALAQASGGDARDVLEELIEEGIRMRRVPGILFADGPTGRRARIAGTGIEVFEVIDVYQARGRRRAGLREWFDWLSNAQLDAAVTYYEAYPDEIDERLNVDEQAAIEALWAEQPRTRPAR